MEIDARGLACPEPVVRVQHGIVKNPEGLTVLVDNKAAVENITRFSRARGYMLSIDDRSGDYVLTLTKT